jgi:acyl-CoA thioesterase-1
MSETVPKIQRNGKKGSTIKHRTWSPIANVLVTLALAALLLHGCNTEPELPQPAVAPDNRAAVSEGIIVAVGDSLTAGLGVDEDQAYPAQLAAKLMEDGFAFQVVNAGVSGETSSGARSRIEWIISSLQPDILILETGANDGLRGVDPDVLAANLDHLIREIKKNNIQLVLVGMRMPPNLGPRYVQAFDAVYPQLAAKYQTIFMPFFLDGVAGHPELNQPDNMHPTALGYQRIVKNLYPYVLQAITAQRRSE